MTRNEFKTQVVLQLIPLFNPEKFKPEDAGDDAEIWARMVEDKGFASWPYSRSINRA